jgi:tryptophan synthase beta chain
MSNITVEAGMYGIYGGRFVPETLMAPLEELETAFRAATADAGFAAKLNDLLAAYCGRPTSLYLASRLTEHCGGARIFLKREDLLHTGSHKINNAIGQALLAKRMGKRRVIAETGAGQHGVAAATACALLGLQSTWAPATWSASRSTCFACACWAPTSVASTPVRKRLRTPLTKPCVIG